MPPNIHKEHVTMYQYFDDLGAINFRIREYHHQAWKDEQARIIRDGQPGPVANVSRSTLASIGTWLVATGESLRRDQEICSTCPEPTISL